MIGQSANISINPGAVALREREVEPHHNPCAQCGQAIAHPSWSEGDERCMSFVWACEDCGYQFTTIAVYARASERFRIAA